MSYPYFFVRAGIILIALWAMNFSFSLHAQTVSNGSVTGSPAANSGINNGYAPPWSGCYFSPDLCNVSFPSWSGNSAVTPAASPDGGTWLGMCGNGECAQTTITGLTVGATYTLYFCGSNFGTGGYCGGTNATPQITIGATSQTFSIPQVASVWNSYSMNFTATASTMTMQISHSSSSYANLDGFNLSGFQCNPNPLPIALERFDGHYSGCRALLDWKISQPDDYREYEVLRSENGIDFISLGREKTCGEEHYAFTDQAPLAEAWYKIRMHTDKGRFTESKVIEVRGTCQHADIVIEENPVNHQKPARIRYFALSDETQITIRDVSGRIVNAVQQQSLPESWNELELDISSWAPGLYFVSSSDGVTVKMVIR